MNAKTKNWIVYGFQIQFFAMLTIFTIFIELVWLFEFTIHLNFSNSHPSTTLNMPSVQEIVFSIFFIIFMLLNLGVACFSLYSFIFILHVLDSNPAKTAPVCPIALDCALINIFFYHFSLYKGHYFTYFAPFFPISIYYHILSLISQISEILIIIAFFTIFVNIQFGIEGIYKSRILKTNLLTHFVHILLITNGVLIVFFLYSYIDTLNITLLGVILSVILAFFLIGFFNFILRKKKLRYPIEAISIWRHGRIITRKERKNSIE